MNVHEDYIAFLHNYRYENTASNDTIVNYSVRALYPKNEQEITLKVGGAYVLCEEVYCSSGDAQEEIIECCDFIALREGNLVFSRHGIYTNKKLHCFGENTAYTRFGNVLKVSYELCDNYGNNTRTNLVFHILSENLIVLKGSLDSMQKFVFIKDSTFESGYSMPFIDEESET